MKSKETDTPSLEKLSPPSRGAWIEIFLSAVENVSMAVAPLAGGVD